MSYQVLARKWRPRLFREMAGQEHVLRALINALDNNRLHHAYLFAGTRGVGKTTIARILAKCLNCEVGVSSEPCGQCSACNEIVEGRFVDLIEVDAASRTKVEDTRELLENVQYAPTRGRYKIYLIDEVHMLSNSSFNALLKTLEEPPAHVKFLLATTDPQKLPVTVLSRCLQFNLQNMSPERVVERLRFVLEQELVPFEEGALWQLGRAADGSMRDAMSLADQAIAFAGGKLSEVEVRTMLGSLDTGLVWKLMSALTQENPVALFAAVEELAQQAPDYSAALAEIAASLHRVAIAQVLPEAADNALGDNEQLQYHAANMAPENVQLYYQMALLARRDLPLAPDPRSGFEMALLRMLAFKPQGVASIPTTKLAAAVDTSVAASEVPAGKTKLTSSQGSELVESTQTPVISASAAQMEATANGKSTIVVSSEDSVAAVSRAQKQATVNEVRAASVPPSAASELKTLDNQANEAPKQFLTANLVSSSPNDKRQAIREQLQRQVAAVQPDAPLQTAAPAGRAETSAAHLEALTPDSWPTLYSQLEISGILHSIASYLELTGRDDNTLFFTLDESFSSLYDDAYQRRLAAVLSDFFQHPCTVQIQVGTVRGGTPARLAAATREARFAAACEALNRDPLVGELKAELGAQLVPESVEYLD